MRTPSLSCIALLLLVRTLLANPGAQVPYLRHEAESAMLSGTATLLTPNRLVGDLAGEASGRQAVKLTATGDSLEWTATADANSIVLRHCIPDSADGAGQDATLSLYVNGAKKDSLTLTSKYAWLYGPEADPKNDPSLGTPRHIYDEAGKLLAFTIRKGDRVMLRKDAADTAAYYGIDFIELERVPPPLPCPDGFINIADEGLTPDNFGAKIATLIQWFEWKEGYKGRKGLYLPPGRYRMSAQAMINHGIAPGFEIRGAGMWHTVLFDEGGADADWGQPGFNLNHQSVKFSDFAIFGAGRARNGGGKPFFNSFGDGTVMARLWIEHMSSGFWVGGSQGVTHNLTIDSCRLRNLGSDGINLCNGTKNSTVVNTTVRSSGDDGIAIWSAPEMDGPAGGLTYAGCAGNVVRNCTVELPWRASAFAIYGGKDNTIRDCVARDTLTYPGVNISSTFQPRPFDGVTLIENMVLERCGGTFWGRQPFGALWVMAHDSPVSGVIFRGIKIMQPTHSAILLKSETYQRPKLASMNVRFEKIEITHAASPAILVQDAIGTAHFAEVKFTEMPGKIVVRNRDTNGHQNTGTIEFTGDGARDFEEAKPAR